MSELALYRKYRSATFDAVIGQPQVVDTLRRAIKTDRLSHAYLFTGPRGTGKTSVARLLARAANCTHEDPAMRPCGECANCKMEIGGHMDLIEIDAASNRGIDDARALREKISSAPSMGRYKVYIIDEVHMLTTEAFNALLKTLEEPPAHAIFILATTEAHKLPETIVSRTQRFAFRPIDDTNLVDHLRHIATTEGVTVEDDALALIAATSRGGFRDAISLLDQVSTSGISPLTAVDVRRLLGHSAPEILKQIVEGVASGDAAATLAGLDVAIAEGVQPGQLAGQLIDYWRRELQRVVQEQPSDVATLHQLVLAIETVLPVLKSGWAELSLETSLMRLAAGPMAEPTRATSAPARSVAARPVTATPEAATAPEPQPSAPEGTPDPELWVKALTQIKQKNNSLYALLRSCSLEFNGDTVIIGCKFGFFRDRLKESKNLQMIEQTLARVYGRKFKVTPQLIAAPVTIAANNDQSAELMSSALEILGGEVMHE